MKYSICLWVLVLGLVACGDSGTGSTVFVASDLTIDGNPSILGEAAPGTAESPNSFLTVGGVIDSNLGLELTGLSAQIRVLDAGGALLGSIVIACNPSTIAPGGSSTFQTTISLTGVAFTATRQVEITPICDQGTGTVRNISLNWPES